MPEKEISQRDFRSLSPEARQFFLRSQIAGKRQFREVTIKRDGIDTEARTVDLSIASDQPYERYYYTEILSHAPGAVMLDRLNDGGAFLSDHDATRQIGAFVPGTVKLEDGKTRGTVKFSTRAAAEDEWQDIIAGIRSKTSVGYLIHKYEFDEKAETLTATLWEPLEGTLTAIPADTSTGIGRQLENRSDDETDHELEDLKTRAAARGLQIHDPAAEAPPEARDLNQTGDQTMRENETENIAAATVTELSRATEIMELAKVIDAPGETLAQEVARDAISQGKTVPEFRQLVFEKRQAREQTNKTPVRTGNVIDLTEREKKAFSISRAILADANSRDRTLGGDSNSFELEISEEIRSRIDAPGYKQHGGILIPTTIALRGGLQAYRQMLKRAGLDTQTDTAGQELVFTEPGSFIDLLRNKAMVLALGATFLPGLQGNVAFPKQIGAGTFTWVNENPGVDVPASNLTLDQVELKPNTGQSTTSYSRQLMRQSVVNVDALVLNDLSTVAALAIDRAAIHGTGGAQPTGVYSVAGVNSVAFGGAITFDKVVDMETEVANDNADIGTMAYLTTPGARGKAKKTPELANTIGVAMWRDGEMNGYRAEATNQVLKTLGAGTEHGIVFGVWSQMLIGEWGAIEIITDPYALKKQGMIEVTSFVMADVALRYAEAFCKGTGLTVT